MKQIICFVFALSCAYFLTAQTELVNQNRPLPNLGKTFSIVAHIVRDTSKNLAVDSTAVRNEIANMNKYFAPIGAKFEVCKINVIPNYALFELIDDKEYEEMLNMYHVDNRINMFFVNSYGGGELFGFAEPKGIENLENEGIVVLKPHATAAKMAHLMGHYFGLVHTFETAGELVKRTNCATTGDKICDTPADPFQLGDDPDLLLDAPTNPCRFIDKSRDANSEYYTPDVGNIMSMYYGCYCSFSQEQLKLMAETYLNAPKKMW